MTGAHRQEAVSDKVLTAPNVITFIRFLMVPLFLWLTFGAHMETAGLVVFAIAASTDWVDGQIARRTNQVSKVGKVFDPLVDRLLLASGVIAVCFLGRLPIWIVLVLVTRDIILLGEGRFMLATVGEVPPVVYVGKFATAFLMFGYGFLLLGMPYVPGLGLFDSAVFPGLGHSDALLGMYLIYIGTALSLCAFAVYHVKGIRMFRQWRRARA